jgi:hypothetical protein
LCAEAAVKRGALLLKNPSEAAKGFLCYFFSQGVFATPEDVLQADWQLVWHSPQPPAVFDAHRSRVLTVLMCFM